MYKIYSLSYLGSVFYVGMCLNFEKRFFAHIRDSFSLKSEKDKFISAVVSSGGIIDRQVLEECPDRVTAFLREKFYISKFNAVGKLFNVVNNPVSLTKTHKDILMLMASDLSTNEIAKKLKKSPRTIETKRLYIKKVSRTKTISGMIGWAIKNEII